MFQVYVPIILSIKTVYPTDTQNEGNEPMDLGDCFIFHQL